MGSKPSSQQFLTINRSNTLQPSQSSSHSTIFSRVFCCTKSPTVHDANDIVYIADDNIKNTYAIKIQAYFRGHITRSKVNILSQNYKKLCKEVPLDYPTTTLDANPTIMHLRSLVPPFQLNEKEKFIIESSQNKHLALTYNDGSLYKGYVNMKYQRDSYGRLYCADNSVYEGFFKDNRMEGRGVLYSIDGYVYDGEFINGLFHGFGKLVSLNGVVYRGSWKNDMQNGYGEETYVDGSSYCGYFVNGKKNGKGRFVWNTRNSYEGMFVNDELTGYGVYRWKEGKIYMGNWLKHKMEGVGLFIWPDGKKYIGNYKNDMKDGFGIFYSIDKRYEGAWKNGKQHGKGVIVHNNGRVIYIEYYEGMKVRIIDNDMEIKEISGFIEEEKRKVGVERYVKLSQELIGGGAGGGVGGGGGNNNDILSGNSFDSGGATNNTTANNIVTISGKK